MPGASTRCERCGGSLPSAGEDGRLARLCATCRVEAVRSIRRARVAEEEGLALTELMTTDVDVAMLKEGK